MRFVLICQNGHMGDVPWDRWAHKGGNGCVDDQNLFYEDDGNGTGLASVSIRCRSCDSRNNLGELTFLDSMLGVGWKCIGRQPWDHVGDVCEETPQVTHRGASNIWYPVTPTAIEVPDPKKDIGLEKIKGIIRNDVRFNNVIAILRSPVADEDLLKMIAQPFAEDIGCSMELVIETGREEAGN